MADKAGKNAKSPLVKQIAERILEFDSKSIPVEVATHAKALILDSIGCALAARCEHAYQRALLTFETIGGNADCTSRTAVGEADNRYSVEVPTL